MLGGTGVGAPVEDGRVVLVVAGSALMGLLLQTGRFPFS